MARTDEYSRLCSTASSREKLAARLEALAVEKGATVKRHEFDGPREIGLDIAIGPYRCMVHFEGGSRVGAFLGHWFTETRSLATYPTRFGLDIRGTLNTYHYGKATSCCDTFEGFLESIDAGLESLHTELAAEAIAS